MSGSKGGTEERCTASGSGFRQQSSCLQRRLVYEPHHYYSSGADKKWDKMLQIRFKPDDYRYNATLCNSVSSAREDRRPRNGVVRDGRVVNVDRDARVSTCLLLSAEVDDFITTLPTLVGTWEGHGRWGLRPSATRYVNRSALHLPPLG